MFRHDQPARKHGHVTRETGDDVRKGEAYGGEGFERCGAVYAVGCVMRRAGHSEEGRVA